MEKIDWKVDGMTCSNCALSISKYLDKQGLKNVKVNPIDGMVSFTSEEKEKLPVLKKGIQSLGYQVMENGQDKSHPQTNRNNNHMVTQ